MGTYTDENGKTRETRPGDVISIHKAGVVEIKGPDGTVKGQIRVKPGDTLAVDPPDAGKGPRPEHAFGE